MAAHDLHTQPKDPTGGPGGAAGGAFYLNIVVVDVSGAVEAKVGEKVQSGGFFGGFLNKAATSIAKSVVTESKVATKVASQLAERIPEKVQEMGIQLRVRQRFQKGAFLVLHAQVLDVEADTLLRAAKGPEFADKFSQMLECFSSLELEDALAQVRTKIDAKVTEALMAKLTTVLPEKLKEGKIVVECVAKTEEDQAEFFFDFLGALSA